MATLRPQVRQPGPAVRTRSGVEGVVKLVFGYSFLFFCPCRLRPRLTCVSHVSDKQPGSGKGQLSGCVLWVRFIRPAWWQTMQSCPVPLDPGPGVRNQLRRERALRSGRRSEARIGERVKTREREKVRRVQVRVQFFHAWRVRGHRSHASLSWRSGGTVTGHSGVKSANVGRFAHTNNATALGPCG